MLLSPFSSEECVTGCSSGPVTPSRGSRWHIQGGKLRGTGEPGDKTLNPVSPSSEATGGGSLTGEGMQGRPRTQKSCVIQHTDGSKGIVSTGPEEAFHQMQPSFTMKTLRLRMRGDLLNMLKGILNPQLTPLQVRE